jgi:AcrR family transcriptional regulator
VDGSRAATVEKPRRKRGRPAIPREVQRQRLIEAARRVLERNDYERATVADIVREAGTSSRSFYEHFAAKEDVLAEIVREQGRVLVGTLARIFNPKRSDAGTAGDALRAYLEVFPAGTVDVERLGGEAGQRVREIRREYVQIMTDLVREQYRRAHLEGRVQRIPERVEVELVLTGIEGLSFRYYSEGRREELLRLQPTLLAAFLRLLS